MAENAADMAASASVTQEILWMMRHHRQRRPREPPKVKCPICNESHAYQPAPERGRLEDRFSHDARVLFQSGSCPICLEDCMEPPMVVLVCGHVVCRQDFQRLGGKIGQEAMRTKEQVLEQMNTDTTAIDEDYFMLRPPPSNARTLVLPWIMGERNQLQRSGSDDGHENMDESDNSSSSAASSMPALIPRSAAVFYDTDEDDDDEAQQQFDNSDDDTEDSSLPPLLPPRDTFDADDDDDDILSVSPADGNAMDDSDIQSMPELITPRVTQSMNQQDMDTELVSPSSGTQSDDDDDDDDDSLPPLLDPEPRVSNGDSNNGDGARDAASNTNVPSLVHVQQQVTTADSSSASSHRPPRQLGATLAEIEMDLQTVSALFRRFDEQMVELMDNFPSAL